MHMPVLKKHYRGPFLAGSLFRELHTYIDTYIHAYIQYGTGGPSGVTCPAKLRSIVLWGWTLLGSRARGSILWGWTLWLSTFWGSMSGGLLSGGLLSVGLLSGDLLSRVYLISLA